MSASLFEAVGIDYVRGTNQTRTHACIYLFAGVHRKFLLGKVNI